METTQNFRVKGMHCASCANIITRTLKKVEGVSSVDVNYGTETAKIAYDHSKTSSEHLSDTLKPLGYSFAVEAKAMNMSEDEHVAHLGLGQSRKEKLVELMEFKTKVLSVIPLAAFSIFIMAWDTLSQFGVLPAMSPVLTEFFHHLLPIFATYTLFIVGIPYLLGVYRFFRYGKANMDTLIGIGTLAAFLYSFVVTAFEDSLRPFLNVEHNYYDVTIVVIAFITLGKYLEAKSKIKTGDAIEKLLNLQAKSALVIRGGLEVEVPIQEVVHGELIIVKPGSKIPVDGVLTEGSSFVDEAMVTGEPVPVEKQAGNTVIAGTINTSGTFTFKATKVGGETMLASIIAMVQEAEGSRAPIQALADKISAVFVPIVISLAVLTFVAWLIFGTSSLGFAQALSNGLLSFVGILVIACPCALGLATPTAIIVGVGKGATNGILIKDAATLQKLHSVTTIVVDKTGTLTNGKPELTSVDSLGRVSQNEIISLLASLENKSEHPIAHAIVTHAKNNNVEIQSVEKFESMKGKGVTGFIQGSQYFAGNIRFIVELGLSVDESALLQATREGKTPVILATKKEVLAVVMVADAVKLEAKESIEKLHALGLKVVMLTGDNKNTARFIGDQLGIDEVVAEVLPQDKMAKIKSLQAAGQIVAMAGDGINDAPALAQADVGIAMATGTDVAIDSAGIILLNGDISKVSKAIHLSKITMRGIKQNLFWAFIYNIVGIPLASGIFFPIFGWLISPVFAGAAMAFSSVSVVLNSLRLKRSTL
jgi:Cu2+-exporting ATPase/Cu+-exporting ATPase